MVAKVPTHKTVTATTAASNFVGSVFRDLGLPDVLVSDWDTRFTSEFWTALHAALGTSLVFGSPHHHNTNAKTERVNLMMESSPTCSAPLSLSGRMIGLPSSHSWSLPSMIRHRRWARGIPHSTPTAVNILADLFRHCLKAPKSSD